MATFHESIPPQLRTPENASVWRYCSFSKFASLLASRALFMARADRFEDVFEGAVSREAFSHYMDSLQSQFDLRDKYAPRGRHDPEENKQLIRKWLLEGPTMTYLSCWYSGASECDAMWKVYGETRESVALRSTVGHLITALPSDVFLLPIRYLAHSEVRMPAEHRIWQFGFKRLEFAYESELRCVKFDASEERPSIGHQIAIDPSALVTEVVVSPRAPSWFAATVKSVVNQFGLPVDVRQSAMAGQPWQF